MTKPRSTKEEKASKDLEIQAAREERFQLVTKIIRWKTKDVNSNKHNEKISKAEWQKYEEHMFEISKSGTADEVKEKLKIIHSIILNNDGFE